MIIIVDLSDFFCLNSYLIEGLHCLSEFYCWIFFFVLFFVSFFDVIENVLAVPFPFPRSQSFQIFDLVQLFVAEWESSVCL